jgi:hypothetical protein
MDDLAETGAQATNVWATIAGVLVALGVAMLAGAGILNARARRFVKVSE